ncbi:MAG: LysR family transcriptional regulator [Arthrobacter sp.]|nr:LysR family transcriptional regulator [Arthrobacter sp.]
MDIAQLRTLRLLDDLGSLRAVAAALYVSPSAVSQQLTQLQREVGVALTRKEGRGLVLTEAGRALSAAAQDVLVTMARAEAAVAAHGSAPDASVSIALFHSVGPVLGGRLVAELSRAGDPAVTIADEDVPEGDFPALTSRYDLVVAHRVDYAPPWSGGVRAIELLREPFDIALPSGHRLAARSVLDPADLADESWVSSREGYSPADVVAQVGAAAHRPVRVAHRVNDYATVASLVAHAGVVAAIPRFTAGSQIPAGVVLRPLRGTTHVRLIEALARPETLERPAVTRVLEALRRVVGQVRPGATER